MIVELAHSRAKPVAATTLLHPDRFDILVKYLYVKSRLEGRHEAAATTLYRNHIMARTGGRQANKDCLEDYFTQFHDLIDSIQRHGFLPEHPIPVSGCNDIILDGSHRSGSSLYFGIDPLVCYDANTPGRTWNERWFRDKGFDEADRNWLVKTYTDLNPAPYAVVVLWGAVKPFWDEIEQQVDEHGHVFMSRDISLSPESLRPLLFDIFSYEFGLEPPEKIVRKAGLLAAFEPDIRVLFTHVKSPTYSESMGQRRCDQILALKEDVRRAYHRVAPREHFITMHASDNEDHARYLRDLFLSRTSMAMLPQRAGESRSMSLIHWLDEYAAVLKDCGIDPADCCIVGSGVMEVLGLRRATDVDFVMHSRKRDLLFGREGCALSAHVDLVYQNYHQYDNPTGLTDDEIIDTPRHHFQYRGLKLAHPGIVRHRKSLQKRPKDVMDLQLFDRIGAAVRYDACRAEDVHPGM